MTLQETPPGPELVRLLTEYEGRGGVLEFAFFGYEPPPPSEPELHREAAIAALKVFAERNEQYFALDSTQQAFINAGLDPNDHFQVVTQPEKAKGRAISVSEFFGPLYDAGSRHLKIPAGNNHGYAYAFADPPYGMRGTRAEINALLLAVNAELFGDLHNRFVIYQWSTEWSTYFDAGSEWWGAELWTIHDRPTSVVIGIGASATD